MQVTGFRSYVNIPGVIAVNFFGLLEHEATLLVMGFRVVRRLETEAAHDLP